MSNYSIVNKEDFSRESNGYRIKTGVYPLLKFSHPDPIPANSLMMKKHPNISSGYNTRLAAAKADPDWAHINEVKQYVYKYAYAFKECGYSDAFFQKEPVSLETGGHSGIINKDFLRSNMIIPEDKDKWSLRYNRLKFANPYYAFDSPREYLFFSKPRLNITLGYLGKEYAHTLNPELANIPFWKEMNEQYHRVVTQLQYHAGIDKTVNQFSPMLFNSVSSSLDLPSISSESIDTPSTIYGTNIEYRGSSYKSDEGFDFSLRFYDNKDLEVYHYFKAYDEYEKLKSVGAVSPPFAAMSGKSINSYKDRKTILNYPHISIYTMNKILHDQIGIYKFIVDSDMTTILYYAYMWGCFPKSVPRDSFDEIEPGILTYSTDWHAQFVEDSNPEILSEFNMVNAQLIRKTANHYHRPIWSPQLGHIEGNWMACPIIKAYKDTTKNTGIRYCLEWYREYSDDSKTVWTGR